MKNGLGKQRKLHVSQTLLTTYPDRKIYKNLNFASRQAWCNGFNMEGEGQRPETKVRGASYPEIFLILKSQKHHSLHFGASFQRNLKAGQRVGDQQWGRCLPTFGFVGADAPRFLRP